MQIKSQRDFWSGLMFIVAGVAFAIGAMFYSFGTSARPGPGYFPFGLGVLLAVLGAVVLWSSMARKTPDEHGAIGSFAWRPLIVMVLAIVLFGALLPRLGMILTLPILVVVSALAGDEFKLHEVLINAAILTAFSWLVFIKGLNLTIPLWPQWMA